MYVFLQKKEALQRREVGPAPSLRIFLFSKSTSLSTLLFGVPSSRRTLRGSFPTAGTLRHLRKNKSDSIPFASRRRCRGSPRRRTVGADHFKTVHEWLNESHREKEKERRSDRPDDWTNNVKRRSGRAAAAAISRRCWLMWMRTACSMPRRPNPLRARRSTPRGSRFRCLAGRNRPKMCRWWVA